MLSVSYIPANTAVARSRNARKSDAYQGEFVIFPSVMAMFMAEISDRSGNGYGNAICHIPDSLYKEHSKPAINIALALAEEKMIALGYYVEEVDGVYTFTWLSEGEE
jgi:hypothetical protein